MRLPTSRPRRPGLSLLEVLVAVAIFLLAIGGISQLMSMSAERALEVQMRNQAARLCQSKLAELQSGVIPMNAQGDTPFDEDPDYQWSLTVDQGAIPNLWTVSIKVSRERPNGGPIQSTLSQMVLDPSIIGSTQDVVPIMGSDQSSASSSSATTTPAATGNMGGAAPAAVAKPASGAQAAPAAPKAAPAPAPAPKAAPAAPAPAPKRGT